METQLKLLPIPAFSDNYFWLLHDDHQALVVDPGDAAPVLDILQAHGLKLQTILVTHHHADHVGGLQELVEATGAHVLGPATEALDHPMDRLSQGDSATAMGIKFEVLDVPGHTAGHIAFFAPATSALLDTPVLFCGDTLFSGGCGRLFEGTPAQMLASLDRLASLPGPTRVCCAHEYTLSNLRFALAVEPGNPDLQAYEAHCQALRQQGVPTLPSTIGRERAINPFLRSRTATVQESVVQHAGCEAHDVTVFAALREWKNQFK